MKYRWNCCESALQIFYLAYLGVGGERTMGKTLIVGLGRSFYKVIESQSADNWMRS